MFREIDSNPCLSCDTLKIVILENKFKIGSSDIIIDLIRLANTSSFANKIAYYKN